jgi:hypothetical protein
MLALPAAAAARCERRGVACLLSAPELRACGCVDSGAMSEEPAVTSVILSV